MMRVSFGPGDEYTPGVAAAFAALLEAIAENGRSACGSGIVVLEGNDDDLSILLSLDSDLAIEIAASR
jgi:hypothetical protein